MRNGILMMLAFAASAGPTSALAEGGAATVVALLVDGLSGEMIERYETPNLDRMRKSGVWTHNLTPTFPAISGPTWASIATGCLPSHHGVVTDKFIDPERGLMDHSVDADWLTGCELIQEVAERQGVRTAALGWWGALSTRRGATATYLSAAIEAERVEPRSVKSYPTDDVRAAEVLRYLSLPEEQRPRLILAFMRGPDLDAHFNGAESDEVERAVIGADAAIGTVLDALESMHDPTTLLVVSDHGHLPISHIVNLQRIMRRHDIQATGITTGTSAFLYFEAEADVVRALEALSSRDEFDVYRRSELPEWADLGTSERIGQLVLSAHPGYFFADVDLWPFWAKPLSVVGPEVIAMPFLGAGIISGHGYAPMVPGNQGVLYLSGEGVPADSLPSAHMTDVHPTLAALLGIEPGSPTDGASLVGAFGLDRP